MQSPSKTTAVEGTFITPTEKGAKVHLSLSLSLLRFNVLCFGLLATQTPEHDVLKSGT